MRLIYGIHVQTFGIEQCLVSPNFSIRVESNSQHTKESTRQQGQGGVTRGKRWLRLQGPPAFPFGEATGIETSEGTVADEMVGKTGAH